MFDRYMTGYHTRLMKKLAADSRTMSSMITGPANFPVRRNEKALNAAHNALDDLLNFDNKARAKIMKEIQGAQTIKTGDSDAVIKLKEKLKRHEEAHNLMINANKVIRKHKKNPADAIPFLVDLGLPKKIAKEVTTLDYMGKYGFASYALSNSNTEKRRLKERIEDAEQYQQQKAETGGQKIVEFHNGKVVHNFDVNRLQIVFNGKPDINTRTKLKRNGFRWSPKNSAWQRQLTTNAIYTAESLGYA